MDPKKGSHSTDMRVTIISGSARDNNNTIRVGNAIRRLHKEDETKLVDFKRYDIPLINQGEINLEELTLFQKELIEAMQFADLMYVITPEYNWTTTPEILNWLHRFGERRFGILFNEKVIALVGVSTGKGGKAPLLHLTGVFNKIISFLGLDSFVSSRIFESHFTKEVLDEDGNSKGNPEYDAGLQSFVDYSKRMILRWKGNRA